ncbi:MAG: hypothetical protein WAS34_18935 [Thiolinea sp.]
MTTYQIELLSQTSDIELMAGIIYIDLHEENMQAWELLGETKIDTNNPLEARPILEKIAKEIINNNNGK